jgi:hypothetical protein
MNAIDEWFYATALKAYLNNRPTRLGKFHKFCVRTYGNEHIASGILEWLGNFDGKKVSTLPCQDSTEEEK